MRRGTARRSGRRGTWTIVGLVAVLAVVGALSGSVGAATVDVQGRLVVETSTAFATATDPGRCFLQWFVELDEVDGASVYTAVLADSGVERTYVAQPPYAGDSVSWYAGGVTVTFTAPAGTHRIALNTYSTPEGCSEGIADTEGRWSIVSLTTDVDNPPPVAAFRWDVRDTDPLTVDFDASSSTDDENIVGYAWDFGGTATGSGQRTSHTFPAPGVYQVGLTVTDNEGARGTVSDTVRVSTTTSSLAVTITPAKNPVQLGVDFEDNRFPVVVEVTNVGDVEVTNVRVEGGLSIGPIQGDAAHKNSQVVAPEPSGLIGTLPPGQGGKVTYTLEGLRKGIGELSALVVGFDGAETVIATGREQLEIRDETLVEFRVRPVAGFAYRAGQALRLEGSVKNLTEDETIGVVAIPVPNQDSNAGNGFLHDASVTRTPDMPQGWLLEPGQEILLKGIVQTLRSAVDGMAEIEYVVKAWVHNDDGTKTNVDDQVEKVQEDGYGTPVRIFVAADPPDVDPPGLDCGYGWFSCGMVVGLENFANGGIDLIRLLGNGVLQLGNYELRALAWEAEMLETAWRAIRNEPGALAALRDELVLDLQALVDTGAITLGQGQELAPLVADALAQGLGSFVDAYAAGDFQRLQFLSGQLVGENPDLVVEGLLKVATLTRRVGAQTLLRGWSRTEASAPVVRALESASRARDAELAEAVAKGLEGPALGRAIPTGASLGPDVLRALGQGSNDIAKLNDIAEKKNLLLLFRARSAEAVKLLEQGLAWWKPEALKIKTVNDIDLRFLGGYSRKGTVQFVEPPFPVDLSLPEAQLKAVIKRDAEAFAKSLGIDDPELLIEVQKRAELRASEWALYHDKFFDGALPGSYQPGPWQSRGVDVGFDPTKQGISPSQTNVAKDVRRMQLTPAGTDVPGGRRAFDVRMEGPKSGPGAGEFRFVTGDTDFLAILNADGTPITDVARRLEVYELLQGAVGMQHGESLTFAVGAEKRAEFLRCCVEGGEAMIAIGPEGPPTAARFVESKTILDDTVNRVFRRGGAAGDFTLVFGARQHLRANTLIWGSMTILDAFDVLADAIARFRIFYSPARLQTWVNGLQPSQTRNTFDRRNGAVLQPNGNGGLRRWSQGQSTLSTATLLAPRTTSAAQASGWSHIGLASALSLGVPGTLDLLPQTVLTWSEQRGSTSVGVASLAELELASSSEWFAAGDRIVIDPGGLNEEVTTITSVGKDTLRVSPLAKDHDRGEMVSLMPVAAPPPLAIRAAHAVVLPGSKARELDIDASLAMAGQRLPACGTSVWRLQIGLSTWLVPESRQRKTVTGCVAATAGNGATLGIRVTPTGGLAVGLVSVRGLPIENPLAVSFSAGDLARSTMIRFTVNGRVWRTR